MDFGSSKTRKIRAFGKRPKPLTANCPGLPAGAGIYWHRPVNGSQVELSQTTGVPTHVPARHVSPVVHLLPSSHGVASGAAGFEQTPVEWSQVPTTWHWSRAAQVTPMQGSTPAQTPLVQTSPAVLAFPSLQIVPSALLGFEQPVAWSQVPTTWHWSRAAQVTPRQ
jgi:hypothetical protein